MSNTTLIVVFNTNDVVFYYLFIYQVRKNISPFIVDKKGIYLNIYSNNAFPNEELCMKEEELSTISKEDESVVIKYLLEVMKKHDIISEDEYHTVLYKYS